MLMIFVTAGIVMKSQIRCKIENYSTEDGLSHDVIRSIVKDQEGFMWFGIWDGISRFDGRNFITYKATAGDQSDLENNRIDIIKEDAFGNIWLRAYDNHIYRFDKKKQTFTSISKILGDNKIEFDLINIATDGIDSNSVMLYKKNPHIVVSSRKATLDHVEVFDMNGRLLAVAKNINSKEVSINVGQTNQVLIFKITSTEGTTISKKIIN